MTDVRRVFRWGAIIMALLTIIPAYYAITLEWAPRIDFDVIGIMFVLMNLPRMTAWLMTAGFGGAAVFFYVRSLQE